MAGAPAERVGEIAAAHGVVLHELLTDESSLEEVFLALTQERRRVVTRQIRSELLKLRTTRTTLGLVLGMVALVVFTVVIQLVASQFEDSGIPRIEESDTQRTVFATASTAGLFAVLIGIMSVTGEFRHGTIRPTLLFAPARAALVAAKGVACALAGVVLAVARGRAHVRDRTGHGCRSTKSTQSARAL